LTSTAKMFIGCGVSIRQVLSRDRAAAIFVGLMSFWCIFNYERRRSVHYFLMVFALLP